MRILAEMLVNHGADVNHRNKPSERSSQTPIEMAADLEEVHLVNYLLGVQRTKQAELDVRNELKPVVDIYVRDVSDYKRMDSARSHDLATDRPKEVADKQFSQFSQLKFSQLKESIERSMKGHGLSTIGSTGLMPELEDSILSEAYQRVLDNARNWHKEENKAAPPKKTASASDPYPLSEQQITPGFTKAATAAMAQAAPTADPKSGATLRPGGPARV
jgi:hypothetical protein